MNKEIYESPEMEIVEFEMADVITTSGYCPDHTRKQAEGMPTDCNYGYLFYLNPNGDCANFYAYESNERCINNLAMGTT